MRAWNCLQSCDVAGDHAIRKSISTSPRLVPVTPNSSCSSHTRNASVNIVINPTSGQSAKLTQKWLVRKNYVNVCHSAAWLTHWSHGFKINTHFYILPPLQRVNTVVRQVYTSLSGENLFGRVSTTIRPPASLRCQLSTNQIQRRVLHSSYWSRAINVSVMCSNSCNNHRVRRYRPTSSECDHRNTSRRCPPSNIHFLFGSRPDRCMAYVGACVPEVAIPRICIARSPEFAT